MANPINPTAPTTHARPELEPTVEERFTAKPQSKAASSSQPSAAPDFMERESPRDTAQTRPQIHTGPGPSTASATGAAGIEALGALLNTLGDAVQNVDAASDAGDVDPKLGQAVRVSDEQLKAIPSKILAHLLNPEGDASTPIDESTVNAIDAVHTSAAAGQAADAEQAFNKPIKSSRDLSNLVHQIATSSAPSDENAPLSDDIIAPMERLIQGDYPQDIMAFVQWVLRESYLETTHSLRDFANRVRFFNDQKEAVRNELDRVRGILSDKPNAEAGDQVGPFESGKFNETYLGSQTAETQSPLSEPSRTEDKELKVLALPHLRQFDIGTFLSKPTIATHSLAASGSANGHGANVDDTDALQRALNMCINEFMAQFEKLPEVEQEALIKSMEADGMLIWVTGDDLEAGRPEKWTEGSKTLPVTKSKNESVKEFLKRHLEAQRDNLKDWFRNDADGFWGGYDGDVGSVTYSVQFSNTKVEYSPQPNDNRQTTNRSEATNQSQTHFSAGDTVNTKAEAEAYVEYLENRLNTIGDDAQLANVDLQNWLQKQQQTLQMMSTISKQLHDTAMAIIRKIGG